MSKVSTPKGTRDFSPETMAKRNYVFNTIKSTFEKYGFMNIETPAMENLSTLTGKYGEEGDRLIFKVLNSGDYLKKADSSLLEAKDSKKLAPKICDRAMKYDLTVPFARYVVQHQNDITFPFKRYQVQPVWRADRPQKGRYREFFQCDADVIGTESLLSEVELVQIYHKVFKALNLEGLTIAINNRKILQGIAEVLGAADQIIDLTVAIDKLDKIGKDKVLEELTTKGFDQAALTTLDPLFNLAGTKEDKLATMESFLKETESGIKGIEELREVFKYTDSLGVDNIDFDVTLARGLDYYTGAIFEIKVDDGSMGSLGGGGRYDNLTEIFGVKDMSGVGISFGVDRICDVMEDRQLYPQNLATFVDVLFINFGGENPMASLTYLDKIRDAGFNGELYPSEAKMKKQMKYANAKNVRFVVMLGEQEIKDSTLSVKNMDSGEQSSMTISQLIETL